MQVIGWLIFKDRLNYKVTLFRKTIVPNTICTRCGAPLEDATHTFLTCPDPGPVWAKLGLLTPTSIDDIWEMSTPSSLENGIWPSVALSVLWKIWDSKNSMVFRTDRHTWNVTVQDNLHNFTLWTARFRKSEHKVGVMSCRQYVSSRTSAST